MSFLSDILNPALLVFLAITMLIIALLIIYFEGKMREQNHKISSMLSLVSSLAEEVNVIKFHLNHMNIINNVGNNMGNNIGNNMNMNDLQNQNPFSQSGGVNISLNSSSLENNLIPVSDDEGEEDDDDDDDDEDEDDEDEDDDEDDEEDDDEDDEEDDEDKIKILNLDIDDKSLFTYLDDAEVNQSNVNDDEATVYYDNVNDDDADEDDDDNDDDLEDMDLNQLTEEENSVENLNTDELADLDFDTNLKSINISTLEEDKNIEIIDYKKLSLNKLKAIVLDLGLAKDVSKMKKNDLLKLLAENEKFLLN